MTDADRSPRAVSIRDVDDGDLEAFFEHQLDPEALRMAVFPARDRAAFMAHWAKIRDDQTVAVQTIVADGRVVGNLVSWDQKGLRLVGYWIGRRDWGRGIATEALALFLGQVTQRPVYAYVEVHNAGSIRVLEKCGFRPDLGSQPTTSEDEVEEVLLVLDTTAQPGR
jgi:RimJ/RimL family protein N-acetyltransferase